MKIRINYIGSVRRYSYIASTFLVAVTAGLLIETIVTLLQVRSAIDEIPTLNKQINRLHEMVSASQKSILPPRDEMEKLRTYLRSNIPHADGATRPGWLLQKLEQVLPSRVVIKSLNYTVGDHEINLLVQSRDAQALTEFLVRIEKLSEFSDVVLRKQSQAKQAGITQLQFEIGLKVRA